MFIAGGGRLIWPYILQSSQNGPGLSTKLFKRGDGIIHMRRIESGRLSSSENLLASFAWTLRNIWSRLSSPFLEIRISNLKPFLTIISHVWPIILWMVGDIMTHGNLVSIDTYKFTYMVRKIRILFSDQKIFIFTKDTSFSPKLLHLHQNWSIFTKIASFSTKLLHFHQQYN